MPKLVSSWAASVLHKLAKTSSRGDTRRTLPEAGRGGAVADQRDLRCRDRRRDQARCSAARRARKRRILAWSYSQRCASRERHARIGDRETGAGSRNGDRDVLRRRQSLGSLGGKSPTHGLHRRQVPGRRASRLGRRRLSDMAQNSLHRRLTSDLSKLHAMGTPPYHDNV